MSYADIINKKKKEWNCENLMDSANADRGSKIPFVSPLLTYCTYGGIPRNKITEFYGEPSGGKAQPLWSKILTPTGWITMADIKFGDTLFDGDGNVCQVDGVYPQGTRKIYTIKMSDRSEFDVADNHLNVVWAYNKYTKSREDFCLTTDELIAKVNANEKRYSTFRIDIPIVDWSYKPIPIDPYLLGALIGDGSLHDNFEFSNIEPDVIAKVNDLLVRDWRCHLVKNPHGVEYRIQNIDTWSQFTVKFKDKTFSSITQCEAYIRDSGIKGIDTTRIRNYSNSIYDSKVDQYPELRTISIIENEPSGRHKLLDTLNDLGLCVKSVNKHIPDIYLRNSRDVRLSLLRGLFDTDGYSAKLNADHGTNGGSNVFTTSSEQLSIDFEFLVRSLGIRDTVVCRQGKYKVDGLTKHTAMSYDHYLKPHNDVKVFSSKKHTDRWMPRLHKPMRYIKDIVYKGEYDCKCIHVTSPRHTYITDGFNITHNTTTAVSLCKQSIDIFQKEFDDKVAELRKAASSGNKLANAQLQDMLDLGPKKVLYVDLEHSFDNAWAKTLGIDQSKIEIMQPPDVFAEDILQTIQELIETGELGLVVLDSIPSLVPKAELEKKFGERTVASLAGLLTIFFRKIVSLLTRYETTLITINQIRDNMDNPYVIKTPGGQAPKFYSSLRIYFKIGHPVDFLGNELPQSAENPAGYIINARITKQKSAPFDRKNGSYYLMCNSGIREDIDYAQLAIKKYGFIQKGGAWFTLCKPTGEILEDDNGNVVKVQGMAKVYEYLQNHREYYNELKAYIYNDINGVNSSDSSNDIFGG